MWVTKASYYFFQHHLCMVENYTEKCVHYWHIVWFSSCPSGCEPGTYNDETTQDSCKDCPEGYYCYTNTTDYTPNECPSGYYCPLNTPDPYTYPCPPGTFNNLTVQHGYEACLECTPGMYCAGYGNSAPTDECSPGWYCSGGANESMVSVMLMSPKISLLSFIQSFAFSVCYTYWECLENSYED